MKAKIIYNPKSGKKKIQPKLAEVVERLGKEQYRVEVYPTRFAGDAVNAGANACKEGYDLVIAVGGDGTVNEVVNGMREHETRPILGYVPSGTSNDFASSLGIPNDVNKCLDIILHGKKAKIDVGVSNQNKLFTYVVAAGAFTKLTYTTPHKLKRMLGLTAYLKDVWREIPLIKKPFQLTMSIDGVRVEGKYVIALIINSPNFAGLRRVIPDSCMDDGIFDIILLPKSNPSRFIATISEIALGGGLNKKYIKGSQHLRGSEITVESSKKLHWNIDGEFGGEGEIKVQCKQRYLEMMVPMTALHSVLKNQT